MFSFGSNGEKELQKKFNTEDSAEAFYKFQMINYLTSEMIEFISHQEMLFISTADKLGNCDCSFRYGKKGFIKVVNENYLIYPEYKGNGVNASLGNIIENPHIGMLLIDFYEKGVGLHINGEATLCETVQLDSLFKGSVLLGALNEDSYAQRWVVVEVEEAYIHCSKHIPFLEKVEKKNEWGPDGLRMKGGDVFKVKLHKKILNNSK